MMQNQKIARFGYNYTKISEISSYEQVNYSVSIHRIGVASRDANQEILLFPQGGTRQDSGCRSLHHHT